MNKSYRIDFKDVQAWKGHLKEHGFVVIANYLKQEECQKAMDSFWTIVEKLSCGQIDRKDIKSQQDEENYYPMSRGGMISYIGHSQVQWDLRKRCRPIFEEVWETNQVKSSFDAMCFMNGNLKMDEEPLTDFLHADQGSLRNTFWCYQGLVCLTNNGPDEGGFVVVADSHLIHAEHTIRSNQRSRSWYSCTKEDKNTKPFKDCFKVDNEAGDFILWDGRTFHSNTYPKKPVQRVCSYICMIPANQVDADTSESRHYGVEHRITSTHHPGEGFNLFPALSRGYLEQKPGLGQAVKQCNMFVMDPEIEDLI